jgi:DNA (cytosine-5)-methyltransferase 1
VTQLVLSLFPGIGLLDMAFEEEGFCVVRGPDLLWGGGIKNFHPPAGKFDGVIGGPPCQCFSRIRYVNPKCGQKHGNLIPEFERIVIEARPAWFLMENVPEAPGPSVIGWDTHRELLEDSWVGGETMRRRRFTFGAKHEVCGAHRFRPEHLALHRPDPEQAVTASGGSRAVPIKRAGNGRLKRNTLSVYGYAGKRDYATALALQGLPADFLSEAPFTVQGKYQAVGNGVPLPMGRAVAKAVKRALGIEAVP